MIAAEYAETAESDQWMILKDLVRAGAKVDTRNAHGATVLRAGARERPLDGHHPRHPYEALVFKGGGAKGAIYPGAIKALEKKQLQRN